MAIILNRFLILYQLQQNLFDIFGFGTPLVIVVFFWDEITLCDVKIEFQPIRINHIKSLNIMSFEVYNFLLSQLYPPMLHALYLFDSAIYCGWFDSVFDVAVVHFAHFLLGFSFLDGGLLLLMIPVRFINISSGPHLSILCE